MRASWLTPRRDRRERGPGRTALSGWCACSIVKRVRAAGRVHTFLPVGVGFSKPGPLNRRAFRGRVVREGVRRWHAPRCKDRVHAPGAFFPLNALKRRQTETGPGTSATRAGQSWNARTSGSRRSGPETKTGSACLESSRTPPSVDAFRVLAPVPVAYRGRRAGSTICRGQCHNFRNIRGGTLRFCAIVSFAHHPWHEAQCARSGFKRRRARRRGVPE